MTVHMLNWIVWSITAWYLNYVLMLNWIVWNRNVFAFNCVNKWLMVQSAGAIEYTDCISVEG